jgi:hypothetical protein
MKRQLGFRTQAHSKQLAALMTLPAPLDLPFAGVSLQYDPHTASPQTVHLVLRASPLRPAPQKSITLCNSKGLSEHPVFRKIKYDSTERLSAQFAGWMHFLQA